MECVVEGHTISAEEWSDGSWQPSPGFRAQEKRRLELRQATPHQNAAHQATATRNDMKPRPPPQRKRGPLPRMPADTIHIVGRPKTPVDLTKLPPWQLVPDSVRAQAYLRITSLQIGDRTIEFHVYAPPPDDAFRGIMFNAYDSFTDDEILKDLQESNPSMPVVGGRRMGRSNHVLVTMLGDCLPRWILYHGVYIRLYPFYPRVEACFNCRKDHPPTPQGTQPTCLARCIVCNGGHATNSSNCKYRFIKKPIPSDNAPKQAHNQEPPQQQPSILRNSRSPSQERSLPPPGQPQQQEQTSRSRSHTRRRYRSRSRTQSRSRSRSTSRFNSSSSPLPCSPNSSQGSSPSSSTPGPKKLAWAQGPPESLKASPTSSPDAQAIADTNSSLNALKSYTEATNTSLNTLKNYTEATTAEINARLERRQRSTTFGQPATLAGGPQTRNGLIMARPTLTVWQWNCRGYRKNGATCSSSYRNCKLIHRRRNRPRMLSPCKRHPPPPLSPVTRPTISSVRTLPPAHLRSLHNGLTAVQHEIEATGIQHTLVEILPRKRTDRSLFVLNVYSPHLLLLGDFTHVIQTGVRAHGPERQKALVASTRPSPHPAYDPQQPPTRIGNSVCRDTSPDLTLCKNVTRATWDNTGLLAGSDHNILAITIETRLSKKPKPTARITEWPKFRKLREERASDTITDINEWITSLQEHVQATTREVETTADLHTTDSRLLHMWDAHAGLLRRWRRQRHNKKLRRRLETLAREIENHSLALAQQQWGQLCDGLNGQMSSKRTSQRAAPIFLFGNVLQILVNIRVPAE
ncbi:hypothetical protein HPB52_005156 [Rhipicephalus sanguineus]|uniref:Tick transposon n=1 Tax=Rhipicephalus sanguineus TaxID=34632 RepID=A0A9D4PUN4_RHISA|nr:hypothetical protein HPB52_005156 [Rhipicephalus sanguineus]